MIKMLLFDLDDTLLNSEKKVTARTRNAILRCADMGIRIGYITTRSPRTVLDLVKDLPVDAVSFYSGAKTYCEGKLVSSLGFSYEAGYKLITDYRKKFPLNRVNAYFEPYSLTNDSIYKDGQLLETASLADCEPSEFQRIIIYTTDQNLNDYIMPGMKSTATRHGNFVINHIDTNKGMAAQCIGENFSILMEETVAFGDDFSDLSMLRTCGTGVAMKNAIYEVKSAANYITDSNDDDGIAKWLEKHVLKEESDEN